MSFTILLLLFLGGGQAHVRSFRRLAWLTEPGRYYLLVAMFESVRYRGRQGVPSKLSRPQKLQNRYKILKIKFATINN